MMLKSGTLNEISGKQSYRIRAVVKDCVAALIVRNVMSFECGITRDGRAAARSTEGG
jgi:hypothetical protein